MSYACDLLLPRWPQSRRNCALPQADESTVPDGPADNCDNSTCPTVPPDGSAAGGHGCPSCSFCCAPTPHLDAMAKAPNSILFHRAYAGSACCSPTRAAHLTGRAPQRSCIDSADGSGQTPAWAKRCQSQLPWGQETLATAAKQQNYSTFFMGKWHLGDFWDFDPEDPESSAPPGQPGYSHPGVAGFDTWFATKASASSSMLNCFCYPNATGCVSGGGIVGGGPPLECTNYWTMDAAHSVYPTGVSNDTGKEPGDDNEYIMDHFEEWLHTADRVSKPWLALLWLHTVHVPHPAMPEWFNSVPYPQQNGDYQGTIAQMDAQIGRLRAMLRELGIANDTAVFYTSDNGPHKQSLTNGVSVGGFLPSGEYFNGLRQCKGSIFEGGVRVPGILEWPAMVHSHRETWLPVGVYDYLPTVLDILGLKRLSKFSTWPLDGVSILPWIIGEFPAKRGKPIGLIQHDGAGSGNSQARVDEEMKLVLNPGQGQCSWIDGNYSSESAAAQWFLFNLTSDPRESVDLKTSLPAVFESMKAAHQTWMASVQHSRIAETMCEPGGPRPPSPPPSPPGPPAPPAAGAFTLGLKANPALCFEAEPSGKPSGKNTAIRLAPCNSRLATQSWVAAPGKEGDDAVASAAAPADGVLKVNEKAAGAGKACWNGNALTLGKATSGKVTTFFAWTPSPRNRLNGEAQLQDDGATEFGTLSCAGCSGMCAGGVGDGNTSTQLVACTDAGALLEKTTLVG
eukprot:COSAG02_NODE_4754_length_5022_cov_2.228113_2_plen_736_part_00